MNKLYEWFICNKLSLYFEKHSYVIFRPNDINDDIIKTCNSSLSIKNVNINRTTLTKYLAVWIDDKLHWKPHIDRIVK